MSTNSWDWIYATKSLETVGWYEPWPTTSMTLLSEATDAGARTLVDIGGGGSFLVDQAIDLGLERVAVLDISEAGLAVARHRLADRADRVEWIVADAAGIDDIGRFDIWHDRAAFHFLLDAPARARYVELAQRTVPIGGRAIIATFADDGPERCSGMPVRRYDPAGISAELGPGFRLLGTRRHLHHTPAGVGQQFQYASFERVAVER